MTAPVFTTPQRSEAMRSRASRNRWWLVALGLLLVLAVFLAVTARPSDYRPLSIDNTTTSGTRALAQILREQGAEVRQVDRLSSARITDPDTTTLVIADGGYLSDAQIESIADYSGDVVFLGVGDDLMAAFDPALETSYAFLPETTDVDCSNPDAIAAETSRVEGSGIVANGPADTELCFRQRSDVAGLGFLSHNGRDVTFIANPYIATNGELTAAGNAALTLRVTGKHETVVWYLGSYFDPTLLTGGGGAEPPDSISANPDFLPPGFGSALYALGLTALVAAFWKARRFGPLSVEPLPVVVRASEATRGRGRLYRKARSRGRATAALRADTAQRIGRRLGVPRSTPPDAFVAAVVQATERQSHDVRRILYGPKPQTDQQMMDIIEELDTLERQVHRT